MTTGCARAAVRASCAVSLKVAHTRSSLSTVQEGLTSRRDAARREVYNQTPHLVLQRASGAMQTPRLLHCRRASKVRLNGDLHEPRAPDPVPRPRPPSPTAVERTAVTTCDLHGSRYPAAPPPLTESWCHCVGASGYARQHAANVTALRLEQRWLPTSQGLCSSNA